MGRILRPAAWLLNLSVAIAAAGKALPAFAYYDTSSFSGLYFAPTNPTDRGSGSSYYTDANWYAASLDDNGAGLGTNGSAIHALDSYNRDIWSSWLTGGKYWITPYADAAANAAAGRWVYSQQLYVPNFVDPASVQMSGAWAADNRTRGAAGVRVYNTALGPGNYAGGMTLQEYQSSSQGSPVAYSIATNGTVAQWSLDGGYSHLANGYNKIGFTIDNDAVGPSGVVVSLSSITYTTRPMAVMSGTQYLGKILGESGLQISGNVLVRNGGGEGGNLNVWSDVASQTLWVDGQSSVSVPVTLHSSASNVTRITTTLNAVSSNNPNGYDSTASTDVYADVYQPATLTFNNQVPISVRSGALTILNGLGDSPWTQRAVAQITNVAINAGPGLGSAPSDWAPSLPNGPAVYAPNGAVNSQATPVLLSFNKTGKLNGTYHATCVLSFQNDQSIVGTSSGDLGSAAWSVLYTVTDAVGTGSTAITSNMAYSGLGLASGLAHASTAQLLDGSASVDKTVSMNFANASADALSDRLTLAGTTSDPVVLSMSYDSSFQGMPLVDWWNGSTWVNATTGDIDGGASSHYVAGVYDPALDFHVGYYGYDPTTNTAWVVINHNSDFQVMASPVPEPASLALLALAAAPLLLRRRHA